MLDETPDPNKITFEQEVKSAVVGKGNIIHNYFYYSKEVIHSESGKSVADDQLPCPYRSLFHFSFEDAEYFFGREVFIEQLYQATKTQNFIPILGASGSGKSSVVFAGLVPRLQKEGHWQFTHFRPSEGDNPLHALALALIPLFMPELKGDDKFRETQKIAKSLDEEVYPLSHILREIQHNYPNQRILLIADQFEEIYHHDEKIHSQISRLLINQSEHPFIAYSFSNNNAGRFFGECSFLSPFC